MPPKEYDVWNPYLSSMEGAVADKYKQFQQRMNDNYRIMDFYISVAGVERSDYIELMKELIGKFKVVVEMDEKLRSAATIINEDATDLKFLLYYSLEDQYDINIIFAGEGNIDIYGDSVKFTVFKKGSKFKYFSNPYAFSTINFIINYFVDNIDLFVERRFKERNDFYES